jgi:membrane-associated phospholipid phosphatase
MLMAQGVDDQELIYEIMEDIAPLITKIKFKYNRPRPSQLAHYVKLNLFPLKSTSAMSPSYPSGHTAQAYVIMSVMGNRNPGIYAFCKEIIDDIAESRVTIGVHYSSDNDFAFEVGEAILKHKKFAEKYGI